VPTALHRCVPVLAEIAPAILRKYFTLEACVPGGEKPVILSTAYSLFSMKVNTKPNFLCRK